MATYPYGMKDLPRVTALPRLGLPRATPINNRTNALRTKTFTANDTFIVPAGVKQLDRMEGRGASGTAGTWNVAVITVMSCTALATTNPTGISINVDTAYTTNGTNAQNNFAGSGERAVTYDRAVYQVGTDDLITTIDTTPSAFVRGDGFLSFGDSGGQITNARATDIFVAMNIERLSGGAAGAASTGFGKSFPGGSSSNTVAPITIFEKVAVTPLASYPIVVPTGGYITITYY